MYITELNCIWVAGTALARPKGTPMTTAKTTTQATAIPAIAPSDNPVGVGFVVGGPVTLQTVSSHQALLPNYNHLRRC